MPPVMKDITGLLPVLLLVEKFFKALQYNGLQ
jgi:hypothetical protein